MNYQNETLETQRPNDLESFNGENTSDFGGKNKARRLKKLIAKGKGDSEKARKLQAKVQAKVDKLAAKGKVDKKRYAKLTDALAKFGEAGLTTAEQEELGTMQDQIEADEPALKKEIDDETGDDGSDKKTGATFLWMPKTLGIVVTVVVSLGILATVGYFILRKKPVKS